MQQQQQQQAITKHSYKKTGASRSFVKIGLKNSSLGPPLASKSLQDAPKNPPGGPKYEPILTSEREAPVFL